MEFANRLNNVKESATFRYSALAGGEGIINLTIGRTNFDTPAKIKEAAKKAIDEGKVHYTSSNGILELRKAIVEKLEKENNIRNLTHENVIVSAGTKHIIFEAVMALIGKGDVVAIPNPSWVSYEPIVRLAEGGIEFLPLDPKNGFIPDEKFFSALENSNPKLLIINSPSNPTGAVYSRKVIEEIVDIARRKDSWILSDEIYEKMIYEGSHFSAGSIYDNVITVNGFSKEFSMTGWRLGYAACSNLDVIRKMGIIQEQSISCATSFVQYGALAAFTDDVRRDVEKMRHELKDRRDYVMKRIKRTNFLCVQPSGAFYIFPYIGEIDDMKYADNLLKKKVAVIPGSPFGSKGKGCVRISYGGANIDLLKKAFDIIEKFEFS